jgi:predicted kinase
MHMNERQRRSDEPTANAVARGLNILEVRNAELARHYMEHKQVPEHVIARVIEQPELRRQESPGQSVSEAITPSAPDDQ